ncbi:MAG: lysine--tRNA ligase [Phycisphaerae bacterium]
MLEKVQQDRLAKLEQVRALGIDPYGPVGGYKTAEAISAILARYEQWETKRKEAAAAAGQAEPPKAEPGELPQGDAAGRLILFRDMGKMIFAHVRDDSHPKGIQIALRKNALDEKSWSLAKLLDLGDIVAAAGPVERTRTGEVTIWASRLTLLCKSLNPMPEKFHGLADVETRYRQRYLDLMANPESLQRFQKRVQIIQLFRELLAKRGFIEVETPILQPLYGGAAARPFTTHHNTLDCDLYMRISPELYLKRLLVGGMGKVYEIGRNLRNEGIDTRHNPEFTMMELYQANADYEVMMEITEELVSQAAWQMRLAIARKWEWQDLLVSRLHDAVMLCNAHRGEDRVPLTHSELIQQFGEAVKEQTPSKVQERYIHWWLNGLVMLPWGDGLTLSLTPHWRRASYSELLSEHAGVDWKDDSAVRAKARTLGIEETNKDLPVVVNEVFEATVEPALAKADANGIIWPVFVKDYPAELCPLTRRKADDPSVALRFECFVAGMEIANAYTELNDPAVQEANFRSQVRGEAEGETMRVMDEDFVTALRHGMPPAGGLGLGIDRVVMLLTNTQSIRDVILFPLLRPE